MSSFIESMALHLEGFTDEQIAQIDGIMPDIEHLLAVAHAEAPRITKLIPVFQMIIQVIAQKSQSQPQPQEPRS